jgi:pimeloyl-ACP methyl ester carboxylesterase
MRPTDLRFRRWMPLPVLALVVIAVQPAPGPVSAASAAAAPEPYAAQQIDWKPCFKPPGLPPRLPSGSETLECGSYRVPRDWNAPGAGVDLTIAVSRLRPPGGQAPGTLLTNPGGPGGPGRALPLVLLKKARARVLVHFEVVGIDVRGTGESTNVTCGNQLLAGATLDPRDRRPQNTELILDAAQFVAKACQASSDLHPFITTEQTVRDLDLLRQLLGRERISWLGYSAGTWLGAYYATYFPERVDRFVLDSNTEFTASWWRVFGNWALGVQRRFEVDFLPYVATYNSYYGLGATAEEVNRAYEDLRAKLAAAPLELGPEMAVYPVDLDDLLMRATYSKRRFQSAAEDFRTLRDAATDRHTPTDARTERRRQALTDHVQSNREDRAVGGPLPLAPDAHGATFASILCNDMPWPGDRASLLADSERDGRAYPLVGWGSLSQPCVFWNRPAVQLRTPTGQGVPPILMVQTERDPATPIEGALRAHHGFAGSRLLTVVNEGDHGAYAVGENDCVDRVVEAYLVDGLLPEEGQSCPGKPIPPPVPVDDPRDLPGSDPLESVLHQLTRLTDLLGRLPVRP